MKITRNDDRGGAVLNCACRLPAADVVEVVRCKDCEHMRTISGEGWGIDIDLYYCAENEILVSQVGYCSDGKLKDGGEQDECTV